MSGNDETELAQLAGRYLDLWVEHWASCLAAPETAAAITKLFAPFGSAVGAAFDAAAGSAGAGIEPTSLRTAPNAGDSRLGELESRVAELERKLAGMEGPAGPDSTRSPRRSGRGARKG